ncbi:DUF6624 domain-containing protein [Phenylobacterium kunshanense]|uniref:Uncharacterized protein n=1 Tax=Phenylobacterium kunshanense TaxID=1445034 RepID=A0A328B853_9CAUL|nr:DUF6624 domain-containing protein [Phenylobacterium kunshanense]RAK62106.1 hypothetical protein DJ019_19710 [Phenylobacterium kunshanense]
MFVALLLAQAIAAPVAATPAEHSPETRILIAPVASAIAKVRADQAALPPPKDDAEKLLRMRDLEQAPRAAMMAVDFQKIPPAERKAAYTAMWRQITPIDEANQKAVLEMLPPEGWFTISRYGKEASRAAFLIVQHGNVDLWRRFVPVLEPLAAKGEVEGRHFALMYDRLETTEGRKQRYGSQMSCKAGKWVPLPIEDPDNLDARRAKLGMEPYASYLAKNYSGPAPC